MKKLFYIVPLAALMLIAAMPYALASHSVSPNACYNDGTTDGENNAFSQDFYESCGEYGDEYYNGFIDGCMSADNDLETCESATDAGE